MNGAGAQTANTCGSQFDERWNPSNTGNIRVSSRFTLAEGITLNVDPSYQYVKANGGGTVVGQEVRRDVNATGGNANCNTTPNSATVSCQIGYIGGMPLFRPRPERRRRHARYGPRGRAKPDANRPCRL